ncbi:hypothetical protein PIB30_010306 [Stylosanthes scabra]|uniref:Uncharacterized protein n=1 Tax=Stylosanthes scabra TaxID=79078 RepID=A0ABU6U4S7_9FABA|nr:hypothetical protein [Stylosanthes scabra]
MPDGIGRPGWDWFLEMFRELPEDKDRDACTVTFSWLKSRFGELPDDASDELVVRHARAPCLAVGSASELDFLAVFDPSALRFRRVRVAIGLQRYLPTSDEKGPRLQAHRRQLDLMSFHKFVCLPYRTQAVEAVLNRCILQEDHRAL